MADEEVIKLLQEIRDLQKQQIENARAAIANQQQALENQKQANRRVKNMLRVIGVIILAMYAVPLVWWAFLWTMRCSFSR